LLIKLSRTTSHLGQLEAFFGGKQPLAIIFLASVLDAPVVNVWQM
jgi:hypothetical protein